MSSLGSESLGCISSRSHFAHHSLAGEDLHSKHQDLHFCEFLLKVQGGIPLCLETSLQSLKWLLSEHSAEREWICHYGNDHALPMSDILQKQSKEGQQTCSFLV